LAGITLDDGGVLLPVASLPNTAIGFGDSITEGVGVDKLFTSWQVLDASNARASWFPMVCAALECEYGQIGTGGQGMVNPSMVVPPLPESWHLYDAKASRLTGNLLLPEPDYIFCAMGTNDFKNGDINQPEDITIAYTGWLAAVRAACPKSRIFCIVPPFGWHRQEILTAVTTRNRAGDDLVHFIDTAAVKDGYSTASKPSKFAYDGVHPSVYGNAMLAVHIIAEVQKILCR
jgi:lysophospholipase L1-like esterase